MNTEAICALEARYEAEIADLRAQLEAVGAGGVSGRLIGARSHQPLWVGEKLLQIARETGLRSYLQGVSANDAKALLKTYADALFAANYAPLPPTAQPAEPTNPMDWPLPCDVTVGHGTMCKGVKLSTLVKRMKVLYKMATRNDADEVASRTPEQRAGLLDAFLDAADKAGITHLNVAAAQPADPLKDGEIAKVVNALRDIAIEFHGAQQLRERIARVVVPLLKAQPVDPVRTALEDFDLNQSPEYHKGRADGLAKGYEVGYRHATEDSMQKSALVAQPQQSTPAVPEADMFWDDSDRERQHHSIEDFLNEEMCAGFDIQVGTEFTLLCASSLPNIRIRVTAVDEEACEAQYEVIDAAINPTGGTT